MGIFNFVFGKKETPEESLKKWKKNLNKLERDFDTEIRKVERLEHDMKVKAKVYAKNGNKVAAKTTANSIAHLRATRNKFETYKTNVQATKGTVTEAIMDLKHGSILKVNAEMMGQINSLSGADMVQMKAMAKDMQKVGLVMEMKDEVWEGMAEENAIGDDGDISDIMAEIMGDKRMEAAAPPLSPTAAVPTSLPTLALPSVPTSSAAAQVTTTAGPDLEERFKQLVGEK
jgi:charged multivesicular body protein 2A